MRAFIWRDTSPVSDHYHDDGGLLVVASSLTEARALAVEHLVERMTPDYGGDEYRAARRVEAEQKLAGAAWQTADPDVEFGVSALPMVLVFPNAGCCG